MSAPYIFGNAAGVNAVISKYPAVSVQEYGPIYKSFGGSRPFVFVESPELVRQVLLTNTYRPVFPSIWLGKEREFDKANILVGLTIHTSVPVCCSNLRHDSNVSSYALHGS